MGSRGDYGLSVAAQFNSKSKDLAESGKQTLLLSQKPPFHPMYACLEARHVRKIVDRSVKDRRKVKELLSEDPVRRPCYR